MILLDTNYLSRLLIEDTLEATQVDRWFTRGEELCTSAIAWYEFRSGPVDEEGINLVHAVIDGRILPYTGDQADESARLFNAAGRARRLRIDAMIAAAAIVTNAELATRNHDDFAPFLPYGLRLVRAP